MSEQTLLQALGGMQRLRRRIALRLGIAKPYAEVLLDLGWKEVTKWYLFGRHGLKFNHVEDGHAIGYAPIPQSEKQKLAWRGQVWSKQLNYFRVIDRPSVFLI